MSFIGLPSNLPISNMDEPRIIIIYSMHRYCPEGVFSNDIYTYKQLLNMLSNPERGIIKIRTTNTESLISYLYKTHKRESVCIVVDQFTVKYNLKMDT